jgi:putative membrane protein
VIAILAAGAHPLVHLNAALNLLATLLLAIGLWQIRRRRENAHGRIMIAALATSAAFLASYLTYHFAVHLTVRFTHAGFIKWVYYAILLSHVLLAVTVPFLALAAAINGVRAAGWGRAAALSL